MIFKKKNKKALTMSFVIALIISLLVIFSLWYFYYFKVFEPIKVGTDKQICKSSVYSNFATKIKGKNVFNSPIRCPTELIEIEKDENEKANYIIAKAMYDCWDQFGEGELELFEGDNLYCAVCSHITFEDKNLQINDLTEYLAYSKIPATDGNYYNKKKIPTYLEYLAGYETIDADEVIKEKQKGPIVNKIDTSKNDQYAVMFVYSKGINNIEKYMSLAGMGIGGALVVYGGATAIKSSIFIITPSGFVGTIGGIATYAAGWGLISFSALKMPDYQWASGVFLRPYEKDMFKDGKVKCKYNPVTIT